MDTGKNLFQDLIWLTASQDVIFTFKGIPKGIHFTISNHPNSLNFNLHISKNVEPNVPKPSITIAEIDKEFVIDIIPKISGLMASMILQPVNIKWIKKNNSDLMFIDVSKIEKNKRYKKQLTRIFEQDMVSKNERFTIKESLVANLENFYQAEFPEETILDFWEVSYKFNSNANFAVLHKIETATYFRKIRGRWFRSPHDIKLMDFLRLIFDKELASHLMQYISDAIMRVDSAYSYPDVEPFDNRVTLVRK